MRFFKENNSLCFKHQYETMRITPWGKNALRVRATKYPQFTQHDWAGGSGSRYFRRSFH